MKELRRVLLLFVVFTICTSYCPLQSVLIQALDYGKDVESVENLIRRHEEMEREISVIKSKMEVRSGVVQKITLKKLHFCFLEKWCEKISVTL